MHRLVASAIVVTSALAGAPAFASPHICWFDHASKAPDGIALHFSTSANLTLRLQGRAGQPAIGAGYILQRGVPYAMHADGSTGEKLDDAIVVQPGDKGFMMGGVHDTCELAVIVEDGHDAIQLKAANTAPGLPPGYATAVLPVE